MPSKGLAACVEEVLSEDTYIEASLIRDRLFDKMGRSTPTIRELTSHLKRNKNVNSRYAPAGKTQIKKYALKKN